MEQLASQRALSIDVESAHNIINLSVAELCGQSANVSGMAVSTAIGWLQSFA